MNLLLALSAADYTALAGALVLVIGAVATGAVAIINALHGTATQVQASNQARHDEVIAKLDQS